MKTYQHNRGFTLVELMVVVAVIGILSAIAVPSYQSYMDSGCRTTANTNLITLRNFEENYNLEMGAYLAGVHTAGDTTNDLITNLKWNPDDKGMFNYEVTAGATGIANSYQISVTAPASSSCATTTASYTSP